MNITGVDMSSIFDTYRPSAAWDFGSLQETISGSQCSTEQGAALSSDGIRGGCLSVQTYGMMRCSAVKPVSGAERALASCWLKPGAQSGSRNVFYSEYDSGSGRYNVELFISSSYELGAVILLGGISTGDIMSGLTLTGDAWNYVGVFIDCKKRTLLFYTAGKSAQKTFSMSDSFVNASFTELRIGARNTTQYYTGSIDELYIWRDSIPGTDEASLIFQNCYNAGKGSFFSNFIPGAVSVDNRFVLSGLSASENQPGIMLENKLCVPVINTNTLIRSPQKYVFMTIPRGSSEDYICKVMSSWIPFDLGGLTYLVQFESGEYTFTKLANLGDHVNGRIVIYGPDTGSAMLSKVSFVFRLPESSWQSIQLWGWYKFEAEFRNISFSFNWTAPGKVGLYFHSSSSQYFKNCMFQQTGTIYSNNTFIYNNGNLTDQNFPGGTTILDSCHFYTDGYPLSFRGIALWRNVTWGSTVRYNSGSDYGYSYFSDMENYDNNYGLKVTSVNADAYFTNPWPVQREQPYFNPDFIPAQGVALESEPVVNSRPIIRALNIISGMSAADVNSLLSGMEKDLGGCMLYIQFGSGTYELSEGIEITGFKNGTLVVQGIEDQSDPDNVNTVTTLGRGYADASPALYIHDNSCNVVVQNICLLNSYAGSQSPLLSMEDNLNQGINKVVFDASTAALSDSTYQASISSISGSVLNMADCEFTGSGSKLKITGPSSGGNCYVRLSGNDFSTAEAPSLSGNVIIELGQNSNVTAPSSGGTVISGSDIKSSMNVLYYGSQVFSGLNDESTYLLYYGSAEESALGNVNGLSTSSSGDITVENGWLNFNGVSYIQINGNNLSEYIMSRWYSWTIDILYYIPENVSLDSAGECIIGNSSTGNGDKFSIWMSQSGISLSNFWNNFTPAVKGRPVLLSVDHDSYGSGSTSARYGYYVDGSYRGTTYAPADNNPRQSTMYIGTDNPGASSPKMNRNIQIKLLRIKTGLIHGRRSFDPEFFMQL